MKTVKSILWWTWSIICASSALSGLFGPDPFIRDITIAFFVAAIIWFAADFSADYLAKRKDRAISR